jgi:uncharacterized protein (TIGR02246 family)
MKRMLLGAIVTVCWLTARLPAADTPAAAPAPAQAQADDQAVGQPSADEQAVRKASKDYVEAFNKHDAKALAELWSPDAVYLNKASGEEVTGREAIEKQFVQMFKDEPELKLTAETDSVVFVSPNVAEEHGNSTVTSSKQDPEENPYSAVYVRRDGKWLLDRVTDEAKEARESHYEQLKQLEWMIGHWVDKDKDDDLDIETDCNWTKNRTFITRSFTVTVDGEVDLSGIQIIGWDASAKAIRSWTFDSDGGYAEATWTFKKDRWFISNKGVLADGRKASMTNVIKPIDANSFTWQTIERTAGGELLPNVPEVLIVRE